MNIVDPEAERTREITTHLAFKGHGQQNENVKARARQQFGALGTRTGEHAPHSMPDGQATDDAIRRQIEWHAVRIP